MGKCLKAARRRRHMTMSSYFEKGIFAICMAGISLCHLDWSTWAFSFPSAFGYQIQLSPWGGYILSKCCLSRGNVVIPIHVIPIHLILIHSIEERQMEPLVPQFGWLFCCKYIPSRHYRTQCLMRHNCKPSVPHTLRNSDLVTTSILVQMDKTTSCS